MVDRAAVAVALPGQTSRDGLKRDRVTQLALTRLVEIVGEAAGRVSPLGREMRPEIPWPQITGMRNRLAHGYDIIDYDLLWDTVTTDLPPLIASLRRLVAEE